MHDRLITTVLDVAAGEFELHLLPPLPEGAGAGGAPASHSPKAFHALTRHAKWKALEVRRVGVGLDRIEPRAGHPRRVARKMETNGQHPRGPPPRRQTDLKRPEPSRPSGTLDASTWNGQPPRA